MASNATSISPTRSSYSSSSFSERKERMKDLVARRAKPRQRKAPAQYLRDRWATEESEAELQVKENDDIASTTSSPLYLDLSFQERTMRLQNLADKLARRRKLHEQREQRRQKRMKNEQRQEERQKRCEKQLQKNDEILEWRNTFEVGEIPPGIERQFPRSGRVPGRGSNWWLVPARTSRTMLERA